MIVTNKKQNLNNLLKRYDKFICGSDQMWNPKFEINHNWEIMLLKFAPQEQKISFAASFGVDSLTDKEKEIFQDALNDFKAISVREESAVKIVEDLTTTTPTLLLDPTMTLSHKEWERYCRKIGTLQNKKFIVKYVLGNHNEEITKSIENIRKEYGSDIEVIDLMDENSRYYSIGPDQFLWLIKNSVAVLTDSFHATVFSILFHRPFVVFRRKGHEEYMFDRLNTLLTKFHLENREYDKINQELLLEIEFSYSDEVLEKEKKRTIEFLNNALN